MNYYIILFLNNSKYMELSMNIQWQVSFHNNKNRSLENRVDRYGEIMILLDDAFENEKKKIKLGLFKVAL